MAHILLIQPPLLLHGEYIDYPYFANAGLWQAAAALRQAGFDVTLLDAFCLPTSGLLPEAEGMVRLGVPVTALLSRLPGEAPDAVVIANSPWLRARPAAAELKRLVADLKRRWPKTPTVLADCDIGGMHFIEWDSAELDEVGIDWGQKYEAETALPDLLQTLVTGATPTDRIAVGRPLAGELDDLPPVPWDLVDMAAFQRFMGRVAGMKHKQEIFNCTPPVLSFKTSRGCVYRCNFCTSNPWARAGVEGKAYRKLSAQGMGQQLRHLRDAFGVRRVVVLDALVNVDPEHLNSLLDQLEALDMRADFPNGMRADRLQESQIKRLARRVDLLSISAESAVERIANEVIGKRFDLEATERVAGWCRDAGLPLVVHWMIGQPGESRTDILHTMNTAWRVFEQSGARPLLQYATPIKGTALHDEVTRRQLWTRREDRDIGPLFQGEPSFQDGDWTARDLAWAKKAFEIKVEASEPKKIILNTTYICNNQCVFCATGNRLPSHGDVAEQLGFMRTRRAEGFELIDFDGGEPTTNPNLFKLLKSARDMGYRAINLTTNGRMMALPRNAEKLVRSPITSLLVSLHGPNEAVHEAQVSSKGAFQQTVAGIANARPICDRLGKRFGVNVTLTKTNFPVLLEYGELLNQLGVRNCNIQFVTPFGRASAATQPDPAEVAPVVMELIDRWRGQIDFQVINLPLCYLPGYEAESINDLGKLERRMCFVSMEDVNLFDYLQSRRRHEAACASCLLSIACQGFYYFPDEWHDEASQRWGD